DWSSDVCSSDLFHPDHVANFNHVFGPFHSEVGQLRNVHQTVLARQHFDECAELFGGNDATLISLTNLDLLRHPADDFLGTRHGFAAGRVNVDRTVVFDVNLGAGFGHDALD